MSSICSEKKYEIDHGIIINVDEPCIPAFHESEDTRKVLPSGKSICVDPIITNNRQFEIKSRRIEEIPKMESIISRARRIVHGNPAQKSNDNPAEEFPKNT